MEQELGIIFLFFRSWKPIRSNKPSRTWPSALSRLGGIFDYDGKRARYAEVLRELEDPEVWKEAARAQRLGKERAALGRTLDALDSLAKRLDDSGALLALAEEERDADTVALIEDDVGKLAGEIADLEFRRMFSHETDPNNAFLDVTAGSGGTEAQDWAEMLLRMYLRWAEARGFEAEVIEVSAGEVAGIKSATVNARGDYAYGWLRTETGIHRLVRKSPFDSGNRRHTSFAAVFVAPEINDEIEIEINPADLRVDVYRASGAGGQHVNKTESAVRLTHLPTGVVVQCQNDRSQHKNKDMAMRQLKAKLYELEMRRKQGEQESVEEGKADIAWGNQIRSYVLDQSRIKDLRTGYETSNTQAVLDGAITPFIEQSLKQGV